MRKLHSQSRLFLLGSMALVACASRFEPTPTLIEGAPPVVDAVATDSPSEPPGDGPFDEAQVPTLAPDALPSDGAVDTGSAENPASADAPNADAPLPCAATLTATWQLLAGEKRFLGVALQPGGHAIAITDSGWLRFDVDTGQILSKWSAAPDVTLHTVAADDTGAFVVAGENQAGALAIGFAVKGWELWQVAGGVPDDAWLSSVGLASGVALAGTATDTTAARHLRVLALSAAGEMAWQQDLLESAWSASYQVDLARDGSMLQVVVAQGYYKPETWRLRLSGAGAIVQKQLIGAWNKYPVAIGSVVSDGSLPTALFSEGLFESTCSLALIRPDGGTAWQVELAKNQKVAHGSVWSAPRAIQSVPNGFAVLMEFGNDYEGDGYGGPCEIRLFGHEGALAAKAGLELAAGLPDSKKSNCWGPSIVAKDMVALPLGGLIVVGSRYHNCGGWLGRYQPTIVCSTL